MTPHETECALALERLLDRKGHCRRPRPAARSFVRDMAIRARALERGLRTPPLTARQSRWLLELVLEHASTIRREQLIADTRTLLRRQAAA
jgi:hypothetical protein